MSFLIYTKIIQGGDDSSVDSEFDSTSCCNLVFNLDSISLCYSDDDSCSDDNGSYEDVSFGSDGDDWYFLEADPSFSAFLPLSQTQQLQKESTSCTQYYLQDDFDNDDDDSSSDDSSVDSEFDSTSCCNLVFNLDSISLCYIFSQDEHRTNTG